MKIMPVSRMIVDEGFRCQVSGVRVSWCSKLKSAILAINYPEIEA